jgi:hypothetical protein
MKLKGYVFPDQGLLKLPAVFSINDNADSVCGTNVCVAGIYTSKTMGNKTLTKNICETLMYYFVPGLLIGCWYYFRKQSKSPGQAFYAAAFIVLNIMLLSWQLYCRQLSCLNFLSRRHTLALVAFTAFYIPIGIEIIAGWISEKTSKGRPITEKDRPFDSTQDRQRWFYILLIIGIAICLPKLFKFTGTQKYGYRDAAMWLGKNTAPADVIAVPDLRISFYAERKGLVYTEYNESISEQSGYVARVIKSSDEMPEIGKKMEEKYSTWVDKEESRKLVIYKVIR